MMIDINKTYKTRDGREVRIYAVDGADTYPVHGAVLCKDGDEPDYWEINTWSENGSFDHLTTSSHVLDLIEVRPRIQREVWVNVYADGHISLPYNTQQIANSWVVGSVDRIACVRLTIDCAEGEGL